MQREKRSKYSIQNNFYLVASKDYILLVALIPLQVNFKFWNCAQICKDHEILLQIQTL